MQKLKTVFTLLFLVCLTAVMIFLPIFINTNSESKLISENKVYIRKNNEITAKQVARLWTTGEISTSVPLSTTEALSPHETLTNTKLLIELVFSKDDTAKNFVTTLTEGEILYYYKESGLVVIDNSPIALNFINISFRRDNLMLELTFEEKTKTLIGIVFSSVDHEEIPIKILSQSLCDYYGKELSLDRSEYFIDENRFAVGLLYKYMQEEDVIY